MRSHLLPTAIFLLATTVIVCRPAHPSDDSLQTQCPGAAAWREKHPPFSTETIAERDKARTISNPELLQEWRRRADERSDCTAGIQISAERFECTSDIEGG